MAETRIHPSSVVEPGAQLGAGVDIGPFCLVGANAVLEDGVVLKSHIVIEGATRLGPRTVVHANAVLGGPPQHRRYAGEPTALDIGADCEIREGVTVHRGTAFDAGRTVIGDKCFLMADAHVGHDCIVDAGVVIANNGSLGGHVHVEEGANVGPLVGVHQFCRIGAYSFIGGCAAVDSDLIPYGAALGNRAALGGLNLVGLKRAGFDRKTISAMRSAYNHIFLGEGVFADRVEKAGQDHAGTAEVMRIVDFIRADAKRGLMGAR